MAYGLGGIPVDARRIGAKAAETITAGQVVALDSSGGAILANAALGAHIPAVGIAEIGAATGDRVTIIQQCDYCDGHTTLSPGGVVYLGKTAGTVTTTKPAASTDVVQPMGVALTAKTFVLDMGSCVYTVV